jgi:GTP diphosphokinase / guanosine-3',5'-bis(diphosphate) 3'-diphosphatase
MSNDIQKIIKKSSDPKLIESAFEFATEAYREKFRFSGENYIVHATRVALILDKMNLDPTTIAFGLLHDVLDDVPNSAKKIELKEIEKKFGKEISHLIEKISEVNKLRYPLAIGIKQKKTFTREKIENLRKMFLALSGDLRVILVELVSRLDGLNFLSYFPEDQQKLLALETLQIFVPIASRLGLSEIRRNLEDTAFLYLFPDRHKWLKENIKEQYEEREKYLKRFIPRLKKIFKKERVVILDINYRAKSYWSTYQKLMRHNMDFNKIHDLLALRIITADIESCYKVLGIIHKHFKPISEEINDYIAKPKINGYRSLHTTVFPSSSQVLPNQQSLKKQNLVGEKGKIWEDKEGKITEIQIRTEDMQKEAEYGICAHWSYKEKIDLKKEGEKFEWLKNIPDFWKNFEIDFFTNKVFCFTPKGDIIVLPKNSTPVDFAYAVHSDIGNHCESAKIGGKIVPLNYILVNGDVVEITINKNKKPSKDWLKFIKSSLAKSNVKKLIDQDKSSFKFPLPNFIRRKITEISEAKEKRKIEKQKIGKGNIRQIYLGGQKGMLIHLAKCCNPQPGDKVNAYLAQNRAAVLHRVSCPNLKKIAEKFPEKIIDASWE